MTPKLFLQIGGVVLILVGILGMVGVIGPTAEQSLFGDPWWFDSTENYAHLILGVVGLAASFVLSANLQRWLVMVLGIVGVLVGLYSAMGPVTMGKMLGSANLQNPADTILHLAIGVWALLASWKKPSSMGM